MSFSDSTSASSTLVQGGFSAVALTFIYDSLINMTPFLIAAGILIIADLYFGIKAATHKHETVRLSRAIRRTFGKTVDYVCWTILSSTLARAFELPAICWVVMAIILGNELISCITNYFLSRGQVIKGLNIFKIIEAKTGIDMSEVTVEEEIIEKKETRIIRKEEEE